MVELSWSDHRGGEASPADRGYANGERRRDRHVAGRVATKLALRRRCPREQPPLTLLRSWDPYRRRPLLEADRDAVSDPKHGVGRERCAAARLVAAHGF